MTELDQALKMSQSLLADLLVVALVISITFALICGWIAARRKSRIVYWVVMGFVFGPFALPFVLRTKSIKGRAGE